MSEMPIEEEKEEEIDEDASIDGLEDVEKFMNEDEESDFTLDEDEVRVVLATAWKQKRQEISKERLRRGFWKTRECPQKSSQGHKGAGKGSQSWKNNEQVPKKTGREAYFCDWSPGNGPRFQCFFERARFVV